MRAEDIVQLYIDRWNLSKGMPQATLLRLSVLRDLVRALHAEKSQHLAAGQTQEAQSMKTLEARIDELKGSAPLEGPLPDLVFGTSKLRKRTRLLPNALFEMIPKDRFERFDRVWESAIAAEAAGTGWRFWCLDAWVEISDAEAWHRALSESIWPKGVVIFVESAPAAESATAEVATDKPVWQGRWFLVAEPGITTGDQMSAPLSELPGASPVHPAPRWKLLYSPKAGF